MEVAKYENVFPFQKHFLQVYEIHHGTYNKWNWQWCCLNDIVKCTVGTLGDVFITQQPDGKTVWFTGNNML
jgi:hypothetical protein